MNVWPEAALLADRARAIEDFVRTRLLEPLDYYADAFDRAIETVGDLIEATVDLSFLRLNDDQSRSGLTDVVLDPALFYALRYVAGPPISADDLAVLSEADSFSRAKLAADPEILDRMAQTLLDAHDRRRFPWLFDREEATEAERAAATLSTAALIAAQQTQTWRRGQSGRDQEQSVADALTEAGFVEVPTRRVEHLSDAPTPGTFCRESRLHTQKADLIVGLWDRRTLAIECKVSNSSVNSYKRLNREAAGKAAAWRVEFGAKVVPAAVLSGVYGMESLRQAQGAGLSLFWSHNLAALTDWIETTRPAGR